MTEKRGGAAARVDGYARRLIDARDIPGLAISVTDRRRILLERAYGFSDLSARTPVTRDTLFQIGSISKSFASIVLLQLQEVGLLDIDDPVSRHLPWLRLKSRHGPVTIKHLMSHTAGLIRGTDASMSAHGEAAALVGSEVSARPGTYFHYSNSGYKILGLVIERLLGLGNGQAIEERILRPLGMTHSHATITNALRGLTAVGYAPMLDDRPSPVGSPLAPSTWIESDTADGSISSTAADMALYARMLASRGKGPKSRLLREESFSILTKELIKPQDSAHGEGYALGLDVWREGRHRFLGHSGGMLGFSSHILVDLAAGVGVVVLVNRVGQFYNPEDLSSFALKSFRAQACGLALPAEPVLVDVFSVGSPHEYEGVYRSGGERVTISRKKGRLIMTARGRSYCLAKIDTDSFAVDDPELSRFPVIFHRTDGQVTELHHGSRWLRGESYAGPERFCHPRVWDSYVGHYRAHNPWMSNFRIIARKADLLMVPPDGKEQPLVQLKDGSYRVGADERSPERIRFNLLQNGRTVRAVIANGVWDRVSSP